MKLLNQTKAIQELFYKHFGNDGAITLGQAPGRVNLIGEHTDYNDGFVFPMAIDYQVIMAARPRVDDRVSIYAADFDQKVEFSLNQPITYDSINRWSNYLRGVFVVFQEIGLKLTGVDIAFQGNVPQGAGLSSSAALEVVTAIILQKLSGFNKTPSELALLCQRAENRFVGMNCGIMDQFISMMGVADHALFLDCRSLEYRQVPLELGNYRIVICQSGVKHSLVESEYNQRRRECEQGVSILTTKFSGIKTLRDATLEQLEAYHTEMPSVIYQRCRHVITENNRVLDSVKALMNGDLVLFGHLMNASHDSLRDDYQVSCREIDLLVDLARNIPGVLGARITGGGFGGCTVNLVPDNVCSDFSKQITDAYYQETGIEAQFFISTAAIGAQILC